MTYEPGFERNPKGNFNIDNNFVSIQSGSEAYLLEDELNELQWIQYEQKAQLMRSIMSSGIMYNAPIVLDTTHNPTIDTALYIKSFNNYDVNTNTILLSIKNYIPVNLNGYVFKVCGTYNKNIAGQMTTNKNVLIDLYDGSTITSGTKNELVYLEMWFENINSVENNQINAYGGSANEYSEFENDQRLRLETTRRIQLKWAIRSKIDCTNLTDVSPINNNKKYIKGTSDNGKNHSNDDNIYICDVQLNHPTKAIDNMYYAIPLFLIKRKNGQIGLNDVTPLYKSPKQYVSKFANNEICFGKDREVVLKNTNGNILELKDSENNKADLILKTLINDLSKTKKIESSSLKLEYVTIDQESNIKNVEIINNNQTVEIKDSVTKGFANLKVNELQANSHIVNDLSAETISIRDTTNNRVTKLLNNNGNIQVLDTKNTSNSGYGDLTVGNLFVKGKSTIIESETVTISDNIILLNSDVPSNTVPTQDSGFEINRGNQTAASLIWDEDLDAWVAGLLNSEDIIVLKNSPTITTPIIENILTIKNSNGNAKINANTSSNKFELNVYNTNGNTLLSSIKLDASNSNKKIWSIQTDNNNNKIATINTTNNIICDNIGNSARATFSSGVAKPANNEAKGDKVLFIDYQNRKIYFDNAPNNWIEVGRPTDIADCDSNFHYDNVAPTGSTRLNYNGYFYATRVYNAVYNDYAEYFEKGDKTVEPGDVIVCSEDNDNEYIKSNGAYSNLVVGVCSDSYGHILGGEGKESDEDNFIPLGLSGRVNVKVVGDINKGDLLVTSDIPGVAMKSEKYIPGTVIGKALESHVGNQINRIKMLIMNI